LGTVIAAWNKKIGFLKEAVEESRALTRESRRKYDV
jgi:hypothetical protein